MATYKPINQPRKQKKGEEKKTHQNLSIFHEVKPQIDTN